MSFTGNWLAILCFLFQKIILKFSCIIIQEVFDDS